MCSVHAPYLLLSYYIIISKKALVDFFLTEILVIISHF